MNIHSYTGRLVKAGRIKSETEIKMLELFNSQSKLKKEDRSKKIFATAKSLFEKLPESIKSIYRN